MQTTFFINTFVKECGYKYVHLQINLIDEDTQTGWHHFAVGNRGMHLYKALQNFAIVFPSCEAACRVPRKKEKWLQSFGEP